MNLIRKDRNSAQKLADFANAKSLRWKTLSEYEAPPLDPGIDEALRYFIAQKKVSMEDAWY